MSSAERTCKTCGEPAAPVFPTTPKDVTEYCVLHRKRELKKVSNRRQREKPEAAARPVKARASKTAPKRTPPKPSKAPPRAERVVKPAPSVAAPDAFATLEARLRRAGRALILVERMGWDVAEALAARVAGGGQ